MTRRGRRKVVVAIKPNPTSKTAKRIAKKEQELTRLGAALRSLGGLAGGAAGSLFGNTAAGATLGTGLGATLSRWLGSGDYTVTRNSLVNSLKASGTIPMMHESGQTIVVRHKEFLGEVLSSQNFTVQRVLPINPGLPGVFPWLNKIASSYQQYEIKGMVFHYIPTSGSAIASTNNALGSVMIQTSYRVTDSPPTTKVELLNEYWSSESVPSETFCHPIECNPKENPFMVHYVRTGSLPSDENQLMYDIGATYVCTSGQQANGVVLGDLWVTYEIELKKPIVVSDVTSEVVRSTVVVPTSLGSFTNLTRIFPTAPITFDGNLGITGVNNDVIIPLQLTGYFDIVVVCRATAAIIAPNMVGSPGVVNATVVNYEVNNGVTVDRVEFTSSGAGSGITQWTYIATVFKSVSSAEARVTIPVATSSTAGALYERTMVSVYRSALA